MDPITQSLDLKSDPLVIYCHPPLKKRCPLESQRGLSSKVVERTLSYKTGHTVVPRPNLLRSTTRDPSYISMSDEVDVRVSELGVGRGGSQCLKI